jgi:thiosulfate reductase cytochrome b subunit
MSKPHPSTHDIQEHALLVRIAHWGMALAIIVMLGSGWRIYDSDPIFGDYRFPLWATLGGDPAVSKVAHMDPGVANALNWHFAGMWLLALNFVTLLAHGVLTGHYRRHFLPLRPREIWADFVAALTLRLSHRLGVYNAVQRTAYVVVLSLIVVIIVTGLAIWKPVQLSWLTAFCGGYPVARVIHFLAMAGIFGFLCVHVALVVLVPRTFVAMVTGHVAVPKEDAHAAE